MGTEQICIFSPGSIVYIGHDDDLIRAKIIEVCISMNRIQYKVAWWASRERRESWVESCEISQLASPAQIKIGFLNV